MTAMDVPDAAQMFAEAEAANLKLQEQVAHLNAQCAAAKTALGDQQQHIAKLTSDLQAASVVAQRNVMAVLKPVPPPSFDPSNDNDTTTFLHRVNLFLDMAGPIPDAFRITYMGNVLAGPAVTWYTSLSASLKGGITTLTWAAFLDAFTARFARIDKSQACLDKLMGLKQTGTLEQHIALFQDLSACIVPSLPDRLLEYIFKRSDCE